MITIKRVYLPPAPADDYRVLVDRLWPRGLTRQAAQIDEWLKEIAPSTELRRWFHQGAGSWAEFRRRYQKEIAVPAALAHLERLRKLARSRKVTLLFASRDETRNHAAILRDMIVRG